MSVGALDDEVAGPFTACPVRGLGQRVVTVNLSDQRARLYTDSRHCGLDGSTIRHPSVSGG
ncbi:MAG: hypothetical protein ACRDTG_20425 [Pseudonocardiaceae bacterium]